MMEVSRKSALRAVALASCLATMSACDYVRLLRPSVLKQLNPRVVRLVNELPEVDEPNKEIIARLFPHGGLEHASVAADGVMHAEVRVPPDQLIWEPSIIVMPHSGDLEIEFQNADHNFHMAFLPSTGARQVVELPVHQGARGRIHLDEPGLYWFGCPVANHAGRGMLGLVIVRGEVAATAKLDRPQQRRP